MNLTQDEILFVRKLRSGDIPLNGRRVRSASDAILEDDYVTKRQVEALIKSGVTQGVSGLIVPSGGGTVTGATLPIDLTSDVDGVLPAANGGRRDWALIESWTHSVDVAEKLFINLAGYSEIEILCHAITKSVSGVISITVSINNGSSYLTTSGDYIQIDDSGAHTSAALINLHTTASTAARGSLFIIRKFNLTSPKTYSTDNRVETTGSRGLIPTANALNALRVFPSAGGNFTAGSIYVSGR